MVDEDNLKCLNISKEDPKLWHRRLGHVSTRTFQKLASQELVRGIPKMTYLTNDVCDACVKGKQVRESFKPKKVVSSSRPGELLHIDLCGAIRVNSFRGKQYMLVIVDDYSRYTWVCFISLKTKSFERIF